MSGPSVAVVGGGIAGLVCACRLGQLGIGNVTVFDTGKLAPGGRCSSRHIVVNGRVCTFDHSAQYFTVSDPRFMKILSFLLRKGAVRQWKGRRGTIKGGHFTLDKSQTEAYIGVEGITSIVQCLASMVKVIHPIWINDVFWEDGAKKWKVGEQGFFDYLVIAHNGKCADRLMSNAGVPSIHRLLLAKFGDRWQSRDNRLQLSSIWALMVAFPRSLKLKFEGAHVEDADLSWVANNSPKLRDPSKPRDPTNQIEAWTLFSTREFGTKHYVPQSDIPPKREKEVTDKLLAAFSRVVGMKELPPPCFTKAQLWGAAVPMNLLRTSEECVFDGLHRVGICGDWLTSPCIEGAAVSGLALAERIHGHSSGQGRQSSPPEPMFRGAPGTVIGSFPVRGDMDHSVAST